MWEEIAHEVNMQYETNWTGTACQSHFYHLVDKAKNEEKKELKRSGTQPQQDELQQQLEDIIPRIDECK